MINVPFRGREFPGAWRYLNTDTLSAPRITSSKKTDPVSGIFFPHDSSFRRWRGTALADSNDELLPAATRPAMSRVDATNEGRTCDRMPLRVVQSAEGPKFLGQAITCENRRPTVEG